MAGNVIYRLFSSKDFCCQTKVFVCRVECYTRKTRQDHWEIKNEYQIGLVMTISFTLNNMTCSFGKFLNRTKINGNPEYHSEGANLCESTKGLRWDYSKRRILGCSGYNPEVYLRRPSSRSISMRRMERS